MNLALIAIVLIGCASGDLSHEENQQLDALLDVNVVFEFDAMDAESISSVVEGSFIEVKIFNLFDKNCDSKEECGYVTHKILKSGEDFVELTSSGVIQPYIAPTFKLQSESEAAEFQQMLNVVFPVFFTSGQEIYQENDTWVFIQEESFGEKNGVIVNVDSDGTILKIEDGEAIERNTQFDGNGEVEK